MSIHPNATQTKHICVGLVATATSNTELAHWITRRQLHGGDIDAMSDPTADAGPLRKEVVEALVSGGFGSDGIESTGSFVELCYLTNRLDLLAYVVAAKPQDRSAEAWFKGLCTGVRLGAVSLPQVIANEIKPQAADFMRWYVATINDQAELARASGVSHEAASVILQAQLEVSIARAKKPTPVDALLAQADVRADAKSQVEPARPSPLSRPTLRLVI